MEEEEGGQGSDLWDMRRLPFGANFSPLISISMTRRAAKDSGAHPKVTNTKLSKMYVDDYLSAKNLNLAIKEVKDVNQLSAQGDFHLQG